MSHRIARVGQLMRQEISLLLERHVKDPRLGGFVTVTDVEVSPDLRHAKVFVSQIGTDAKKEEILAALATAAGFLRVELGKTIRLRRIPELTFHWDESIERGARILDLIDRVSADDQHKQHS